MRDLEHRLVDLGSRVQWPDADVAGEVRVRLDAAGRQRPRRTLAVAAMFVVVLVVAFGTAPGRTAMADLLGVVGIEIQWSDGGAIPDSHRDLALGEAVTLETASRALGHAVLVPQGSLGPPDGVFVEGSRISTVWNPTSGLPEVGDSGIGLLHVQFAAHLDAGSFSKKLEGGTRVWAVDVRGAAGFWIDGTPHVLTYIDPDGTERIHTARLAGNVLVWEEDGVTHRIESSLPMGAVISIAESLRGLGESISLKPGL